MNTELKLISMRDIQTEDVQWLWYPYLPRGKLTIVQGDPGEGKTTFVLAVISALTRGEPLPECEQAPEPVNVIYQTAEDGLADTIKPRLEAAGADCACALPGFVDSKNEEKTERNAGYLVVSHSGGGMLRQGTRKGIRRTPANRGMRAHWVVKGLDISEDVCHGMCP